jgi:hypothetical protein
MPYESLELVCIQPATTVQQRIKGITEEETFKKKTLVLYKIRKGLRSQPSVPIGSVREPGQTYNRQDEND